MEGGYFLAHPRGEKTLSRFQAHGWAYRTTYMKLLTHRLTIEYNYPATQEVAGKTRVIPTRVEVFDTVLFLGVRVWRTRKSSKAISLGDLSHTIHRDH
jgi:hypothetical protein